MASLSAILETVSSVVSSFWKKILSAGSSFWNFCKRFWRGFWREPHNKATFWFLVVALISSSALWDVVCKAKDWPPGKFSALVLVLGALPLLSLLGYSTYAYRAEIWRPLQRTLSKSWNWARGLFPSSSWKAPEPEPRQEKTSEPGSRLEGASERRRCDRCCYALVLLLLWIPLVNRVEQFGWFQHLEATFLDMFARGQRHETSGKVFIVEITEDDYKSFFDEHSPLDAGTVLELIKAMGPDPAVIGVDLDTRDPMWRLQVDNYAAQLKARNIIWADVPKPGESDVALADTNYSAVCSPSDRQQPKVVLDCVLGTHPANLGKIGVVRFPEDVDGVVRRLYASYTIEGGIHGVPDCLERSGVGDTDEVLSFHKAVGKELRPNSTPSTGVVSRTTGVVFRWLCNAILAPPKLFCWANKGWCASETKEDYFSFSGDRYTFQIVQAREFLDKNGRAREDPEVQKMLCGNVVLIGGSYKAARDEYWTPLGKMAGVELIANAIESELHGNVHSAPPCMLWFLDFAMGSWIVIVYFIWQDSSGIALVVSLLSILVVLVPAAIAFYWLATWLNVAPVMGGMVIHQMLESSHRDQNP